MDNVNYNFQIVEKLFETKKVEQELLLNKPIFILIVSIIECTLYDLLRRVKEHRKEIIPGLDRKSINDTRNKVTDELSPIISHIQKHNYLQIKTGDTLYEDLDNLRKIRNRIHIQNRSAHNPIDEYQVWSDANLNLAGKTLERIYKVLCLSYPRPNKEFISFSVFPRPWL